MENNAASQKNSAPNTIDYPMFIKIEKKYGKKLFCNHLCNMKILSHVF